LAYAELSPVFASLKLDPIQFGWIASESALNECEWNEQRGYFNDEPRIDRILRDVGERFPSLETPPQVSVEHRITHKESRSSY